MWLHTLDSNPLTFDHESITLPSVLPPQIFFFLSQFSPVAEVGLYSQHFIFVVTYDWAQKPECFSLASLSSLVQYKHPSLLGPFVNYEEKSVVITYPGFEPTNFWSWVNYSTKCVTPTNFFLSFLIFSSGRGWAVFTTLYFHHNLWLGPKSFSVSP
jgi:hypothetical protein